MGYRNIRMGCYLFLYRTKISRRIHLSQYTPVENDTRVVGSNVGVFLAELVKITFYSEVLDSFVNGLTSQIPRNRKVT